MLKLKAEATKIVKVLNLKWTPIAGRFSDDAEEQGSSTRKLSVCQALSLAKRENLVIALSKENCTCPGGRYYTGLEIAPIESFAPTLTTKRHKVFDSANTALSSIRKQPQPKMLLICISARLWVCQPACAGRSCRGWPPGRLLPRSSKPPLERESVHGSQ